MADSSVTISGVCRSQGASIFIISLYACTNGSVGIGGYRVLSNESNCSQVFPDKGGGDLVAVRGTVAAESACGSIEEPGSGKPVTGFFDTRVGRR